MEKKTNKTKTDPITTKDEEKKSLYIKQINNVAQYETLLRLCNYNSTYTNEQIIFY